VSRRIASGVLLLFSAATLYGGVPHNWIFVVDNSPAMRRVVPDVKASIAAIPDANDSAMTLTFDRGRIGAALAKALDAASARPSRECAIVVYTISQEDADAPISILSSVPRAQELRPPIFFVSLGEHDSQFDLFAEQTDRTKVFRPESRKAIRDATVAIRKAVQPPRLAIVPESISFGAVTAGDDSEERDVTITSDRRVIVTIALENAAGVTMRRRDNIVITESSPAHLSLKVSVAKNVAAGSRELRLRVGEKIVPARAVIVAAPPPFARYGALSGVAAICAAYVAARIRRRAARSTTSPE